MIETLRKKNSGFTLIEVMLSIAILALISIPLMNYFSDSLRYSGLTAQKQKATLLAQETLEFIKSQDALMKWQSKTSSSGTTVMHYDITEPLKTKFGVPVMTYEQLASEQPSLDSANGKGTLVYDYLDTPDSYPQGFDVRVTIQTNTGATEISSPIVYGIDDTTNVVIAEGTEEDEAIMDFLSKNAMTIIQQNGGYIIAATPEPTTTPDAWVYVSPDPTTTPGATSTPEPVAELTESDVKEKMKRTIYIDMDMSDALIEGAVTKVYSVKAYYEYECPFVTNMDPAHPATFVSSPLVDTSVRELEGVYLMFNKLTNTDDKIVINWMNSAKPANYPEFRLICQNISEGATPAPAPGTPTAAPAPEPTVIPDPSEAYVPVVKFINCNSWEYYKPTFKTNLTAPNTIALDPLSEVVDKSAPDIEALTDSGNAVRVFKITVDVYKKGDRDAGEQPLIEMVTSKTE